MKISEILNLNENAGDEYVLRAPVSKLSRIYNPFDHSPWIGIEAINPDDVTEAIEQKRFSKIPYGSIKKANEKYHVERIAYLVVNPDPTPIDIVPNIRGSYELDDGFHRLAAAIYRNDKTIPVAFGGTKEQLRKWLEYY